MTDTPPPYTTPRPDEQPCPVCQGAGAWDKLTGALVYTWPIPRDAMRCPFCEGTRRYPPKVAV